MLSTRRRLLARAVQLVAAGAFIASRPILSATTEYPLFSHKDMAQFAFDLFPHEALDEAVYQSVAQQVLSAGNPDHEAAQAFFQARADGQPWSSLPRAERLAIVRAEEDSPHFASLRAAVIEALYRDERMWAMVGYGGSAIEHGGYLRRGFDDIDWLPAGEMQP